MESVLTSILFFAVIIWALAWKGFALWRAARENKRWFIIILVANSAGFLELVYLYWKTKNPRYLWLLGVSFAGIIILAYIAIQDPEFIQRLFKQ